MASSFKNVPASFCSHIPCPIYRYCNMSSFNTASTSKVIYGIVPYGWLTSKDNVFQKTVIFICWEICFLKIKVFPGLPYLFCILELWSSWKYQSRQTWYHFSWKSCGIKIRRDNIQIEMCCLDIGRLKYCSLKKCNLHMAGIVFARFDFIKLAVSRSIQDALYGDCGLKDYSWFW